MRLLNYKKNSFLMLFILSAPFAYSQTRSYVQTEVTKISGIMNDNDVNNMAQANKQTSRVYYDGSARPVQQIMMQASPLQADIVQPVVYDNLGRQTIHYLPYASTSVDGSYHPAAIATEQPAYYSNGTADKVTDDGAPYSQQIFEASPLQRLLKAGSAGTGFQPITGQHYKSISYAPNS